MINNLNVKTINNSNIRLTHAKLIMISAKCNPWAMVST